MSSHLKAELAVTCSTLGRLHKGEYLIEPECIESVKDLIRYLKRDSESHEIRRYLGESKVLPNDLIHIIKSCPDDHPDLFDVTLRLLINLTTPALLFYGEEIPEEKIARNIYLSLVGYSQDYKFAFCDVEFWNKICGKLTDLFETDWAERSMDDGIQIERILMLLRNVLQVPADFENEKRPENDLTVHDKVLWALRQSQILELLLFVSSNVNEEQYYLNLLEIFSLILREQNPKLLAHCEIQRSTAEKCEDTEELVRIRESEKVMRNKYVNMRKFDTTFVVKGVKSLSNHDVVCHKSLDKVNELDLNRTTSRKVKVRGSRAPIESERTERRSTYSVRLFLKEFCLEFLSNSFSHLMNVVKNKLDSGKSLANDQTYYFWALGFFLDFATGSGSEVNLIENFLSSESFHFVQTSMDNAFDHLNSDKKKAADWIKRIHLILKAYRSLLECLFWMDSSKSPLTRSVSREIKSQIFYVVEYREMTLHLLLHYDSTKFSVSYLRDLIETTHLFIKLLEEYSKQTKLVVQKITRKKVSNKKGEKIKEKIETREEKWERVKYDVYDTLCSESCFPEIPPFDAALEIPIDDQKGRAMKNIQKFLLEGNIKQGIGLLRSARQVWPENDYFGADRMSVEDETKALQEICLADLEEVEAGNTDMVTPPVGEEMNEEEDDDDLDNESRIRITEQDFDIMEYKKRLINKKVVESCSILLRNYQKNSDHTNHCAIKLLHRIGWECCMPAMLYQASLFWTLLKIMRDKAKYYQEINTFTINLIRKFRKHAEKTPVVFLELLFWKEQNVAVEIQHGYEPYETKAEKKKFKRKPSGDEEEGVSRRRKKKTNEILSGDGSESNKEIKTRKKRTKNKKKSEPLLFDNFSGNVNGGESLDLKTTTNSSNVVFSSRSELDGDEADSLYGSRSPRGTTRHSRDEDDEREEMNFNVRTVDHTAIPASMEKIRESSDEEKNGGRIHLNMSSPESQSPKVGTKSNRRRVLIYSSDEEKEDETIKSKVAHDSVEERTLPDKPFPEEKDSDNSQNSQTSIASSKKRTRIDDKKEKTKESFVDSDGISRPKRIRYIGSDSDLEDFKSENEGLTTIDGGKKGKEIRKRRRRILKLKIIDSDSDFETNFLDDK